MGKLILSEKRREKGLYWDKAASWVSGCRPVSTECTNCWAASMAHMRSSNPNQKVSQRNAGITGSNGRFNGVVRFNSDWLNKPINTTKPTVWAVWTDLFYGDEADRKWCVNHGVPFKPIKRSDIIEAFVVMQQTPHHRYLVLTKRLERMHDILASVFFQTIVGKLQNVMLMTTAGTQATYDERVPWLLRINWPWYGLSMEPLLGQVTLSYPGLDWITMGGESGHGARPTHPDWFRRVRDDCIEYRVPLHFKQHGEWLALDRDPNGWRSCDTNDLDRFLPDSPSRYAWSDGSAISIRVGKKEAGRVLDGIIQDNYPAFFYENYDKGLVSLTNSVAL